MSDPSASTWELSLGVGGCHTVQRGLLVRGNQDNPVNPTLEETAAPEQYRTFLDQAQEVAHVGSWVAELDGSDRLSWSAETYRIFGVSIGEFGGTSESFFTFVHADDRAPVRAAREAAITDRHPYEIEHRIVTPAGEMRWVREKADVLRNDEGLAIRMIGTVQDVTERRQLEEQLRHALKMEAVGRLTGGVTHDLNNALTAIVGYTELALAALAVDHPAREDVAEIRRAAARAESVTRRLLAFSRKTLFEPRTLDLGETLDGLARLLSRVLGDNIVLRTSIPPSLPPILGDLGQVEQAIINLAMNARDTMPQGGEVVLAASVDDVDDAFARAHVPMPPGRYVVLAVTDTGHGISADVQARIFEPFFTTKDVGKGTGLGLAMVYGTVKQSGGYIFVDSAIGRGTTFRLYFPPIRPQDRTPQPASHPPPSASADKTLLIVEDDPLVLNLVAAALATEGYRLLKARSGQAALDLIASDGGSVDLLLTDGTMPGIGGVQLARRLLATRPGLPVLIMSGYAQDAAGLDALGGSLSTLQKPFTPKELRARIRDALDRKA